MFMKRSVVGVALDHIAAASLPNADVIAARYAIPDDPEAAAFVALGTFRSGGEPIAQADMEEMLRLRNFGDVEWDTSPLANFDLWPAILVVWYLAKIRYLEAVPSALVATGRQIAENLATARQAITSLGNASSVGAVPPTRVGCRACNAA
jgi:hypothetical protein